MSGEFSSQLLRLLPAVHQIRDARQQQSLQYLLQVIGEQVDHVHNDIDRLYSNWFIETCDDWAVPYIADLVGFRKVGDSGEPGDVAPTSDAAVNRFAYPRREVANAVRLRRRKGTLSVLEDIAFNTTGFYARAVEFGQQILTTPDTRFPDLSYGTTVEFRNTEQAERIGTPFSSVAHTTDFRQMQAQPSHGWYGPQNVGLFVWRRPVFRVTRSQPRCLALRDLDHTLFSFHPLGVRCPLFVKPHKETDELGIADEHNLPIRLTRSRLADSSGKASSVFYGGDKSLLLEEWIAPTAYTSGYWRPIPAENVIVDDLSGDLRVLDAAKTLAFRLMSVATPSLKSSVEILLRVLFPTAAAAMAAIRNVLSLMRCAVVDPQCGLLLAPHDSASQLRLTWNYSLASAIGGGEYPRETIAPAIAEYPRKRIHTSAPHPEALSLRTLIEEAHRLERCDSRSRKKAEPIAGDDVLQITKDVGLEFADSLTWKLEQLVPVEVFSGVTLELRARNKTRPVLELQGRNAECSKERIILRMHPGAQLILDGLMLTGDPLQIEFLGPDVLPEGSSSGAAVSCDCSSGSMKSTEASAPNMSTVAEGNPVYWRPAKVVISHCTFLSADGCHCDKKNGPAIVFSGERGSVNISSSIVGNIQVINSDCQTGRGDKSCPTLPISLSIRDSIIDGSGRDNAIDSEVNCEAPVDLTIRRSTVLGNLRVQKISVGDDCIFTGDVQVREQQHGFLRYSYVPIAPEDLPVPLVASGLGNRTPRRFRCQPDLAKAAIDQQAQKSSKPNKTSITPTRPRLQFLSVEYGQPDYCQLPIDAPIGIAQAAESESEPGAFHNEYFPQRRSRLEQQLIDFTPVNMQSAVLFADEL